MKSIGYVLSYRSPNYVRTASILNALALDSEFKVYTAINSRKGILRYLETTLKLLKMRIRHNPDLYILGFRGHEIFPIVRILTLGKELVFDEFISIHDSLTQEKKESNIPKFLYRIIYLAELGILKLSNKIITDTPAHQNLIVNKYSINPKKVNFVYVGTDEKFFYPKKNYKGKILKVFFYANFAPLHGVKYIIEAAKIVQDSYGKKILFQIVGGKGNELDEYHKKIQELNLENIEHTEWMEYEVLRKAIWDADICLGGPFGNTKQSRSVITGKTFQFLATGKATIIGEPSFDHHFVDKKNCMLVEQGSANQIASSIIYLFENSKEIDRIGDNGRELFLREFSSKQILKSLKKFIKN